MKGLKNPWAFKQIKQIRDRKNVKLAAKDINRINTEIEKYKAELIELAKKKASKKKEREIKEIETALQALLSKQGKFRRRTTNGP